MAKVGLSKAAELTGKSPSTIHRAMDRGRLSFEKNDLGDREIDTAELFRVFPPKKAEDGPQEIAPAIASNDARHSTQAAILEAQLQAEREKFRLLERQLEDIREDRDHWRAQAERLALPAPKEPAPLTPANDTTQAEEPKKSRWKFW